MGLWCYSLIGSGNAHGIRLSNFRALCGLIEPVTKLLNGVQGNELTLLKALNYEQNNKMSTLQTSPSHQLMHAGLE